MAGLEFFANPFQISMLDRLSDILVSCRPLLGFMSGPLGPLLQYKTPPRVTHCVTGSINVGLHPFEWRDEIQIKDASSSRLQFPRWDSREFLRLKSGI